MDVLVIFFLCIVMILVIMVVNKTKDIFNPLVLFYTPLIINYLIYYFLYSMDYEISKETKFIFLLGIVSFGLGYLIFLLGRKIGIEKRYNKNFFEVKENIKELHINNSIFKVYIIIGIIGFVIGVREFFYYGMSGVSKFLINIRLNYMYGEGVSFISKYGSMVLHISTCIYFYKWLRERKKENVNNKLKIFLLVFLIIASMFSTLFSVARTVILQYTLTYIYIFLHFNLDKIGNKVRNIITLKNINKLSRRILLIIILLIVIFIIIAQLTGKSGNEGLFNKNFFLYKYLGYSLIAFDLYIKDFPSTTNGYYILGPLGKIFNTLGFVDSGYINGFGAPLGSFNVYSFLRDPYMDFGMSGVIIIMFIIGFFVSMLYSKSNESGGLWTIFYANYIYAIIIAFYAYQFSNTFYVYLAILMYITTLFTKKRKVNL